MFFFVQVSFASSVLSGKLHEKHTRTLVQIFVIQSKNSQMFLIYQQGPRRRPKQQGDQILYFLLNYIRYNDFFLYMLQ